MKDWTWHTVFCFIFCIVIFSFLWFCVGYLYGGINMAQWVEDHPTLIRGESFREWILEEVREGK